MSKDYVSREDVTESVYQALCEPSDSDAWRRIGRAIRELPAADVVGVVRCKDCKHLQLDRPLSRVRDTDHFLCNTMNRYIPTDGYCYYGERKDDLQKTNNNCG